MKRGLKVTQSSASKPSNPRYNRYPDEKGTESIEALSPDIEIPFAGVPETESVPFGGVPEGTLIGVEDTSERTIKVEIVVPTTEGGAVEQGGDITRTPAGARRPRPPEESDVMHDFFTEPFQGTTRSQRGIANRYSEGELAILERIGEGDAALPISQENLNVLLGHEGAIAQNTAMSIAAVRETGEITRLEVETRSIETTDAVGSVRDQLMTRLPEVNAAVEGVRVELTTLLPPVRLEMATVNTNLLGGFSGVDSGLSQVKGAVEQPVRIAPGQKVQADVGTPAISRINETVAVRGAVTIAGGQVLSVRIENVSDLISQIDDTRSQAPAGDFDDA